MGYQDATSTKLLFSNCVVCGRPLVDAISVEHGIGPECRKGQNFGINEETQKACNKLVYEASVNCMAGKIDRVNECADAIQELGLNELASKIRKRFKNARKNVSIEVKEQGDYYSVKTPFRRGEKDAFIQAWRDIKGRIYENGRNYIPVDKKTELWNVLKKFFPGKYGEGDKGIFRIP